MHPSVGGGWGSDMSRPSVPRITRQAAIEAALHSIDEIGLDNFSLTLVAQQLGVVAPSLYHHFRDKDEVLAEVARLILLQGEKSTEPGDKGWREAMLDLCLSVRRSILRHPKAAPLLLLYPPRHLALRGYERFLLLLAHKSVPRELHNTIISGLDSIVFGSALLLASTQAAGIERFPKFNPVDYPALTYAIAENRLDDESMFVRVACAFLDGIVWIAEEDRRSEARHPEEVRPHRVA
jgi:TetR/AcrR family tetracycline transcriptional repressor